MNTRLIRRTENVVPFVALVVVLTLFALTIGLTGRSLSPFDGFNAMQGLAQIGLLALPLGLTMIAGEFDVSVIGVSALGGMLAVQLGQEQPVLGVAAAVAIGLAIGSFQGVIIAKLRLASMPVTIASYIALLGLTSVLSGGLTETYRNVEVSMWVDKTILMFFSPRSLLVIALFLMIALILGYTRFGAELRAIGNDRRAARVSGVPVDRRLITLFTVSGGLAALGGALLAFSYSSANPNPGIQPLVLAAVAALIGGISLSGGRGTVLGLLAGTIAVAALSQLVLFAKLPGFVTQLMFALFLAIVVLADAPGLRAQFNSLSIRFRERKAGATS